MHVGVPPVCMNLNQPPPYLLFVFFLNTFVEGGVQVPRCSSESQTSACSSQFSPSILWVLRTKLKPPGPWLQVPTHLLSNLTTTPTLFFGGQGLSLNLELTGLARLAPRGLPSLFYQCWVGGSLLNFFIRIPTAPTQVLHACTAST